VRRLYFLERSVAPLSGRGGSLAEVRNSPSSKRGGSTEEKTGNKDALLLVSFSEGKSVFFPFQRKEERDSAKCWCLDRIQCSGDTLRAASFFREGGGGERGKGPFFPVTRGGGKNISEASS